MTTPDGNVSHLNGFENSVQNEAKQVVKIAPRESNFMTLEADQATETVASFTLITPSAKVLISRGMNICWCAKVEITDSKAHTDHVPDLPPCFAPVANPLAKAVQDCSISINGQSDNVESSIISKVTELVGDHDRLQRSMEPRQSVRGGCIGAIPVVRHKQDYFFGGARDEGTNSMVNNQPDVWAQSYLGSSNRWVPISNVSTPSVGNTPGKRVVIYEFVSPIPHDLFTDHEEEALVNVNELRIFLKFHSNLLGRIFAWRGGFYGVGPCTAKCSISMVTPGHDMQLQYRAVTSASEASVPNELKTLFTSYTVIRELVKGSMEPKDDRQNKDARDEPDNDVIPKTLPVIMKATRLLQIPSRIFIFACPTQASLDGMTQSEHFQTGLVSVAPLADDANPVLGVRQGIFTVITRGVAAVRRWAIHPEALDELMHGKGVLMYRVGDAGAYTPIDLRSGTMKELFRIFNVAGINQDAGPGAGSVFKSTTPLRDIVLNGTDLNAIFSGVDKHCIAYGPHLPTDAANRNYGMGNEIPALKISNVRIALNNKVALLMVPSGRSDQFYFGMNSKNGVRASFQDFKQGGPIVIDVGDDLGSLGLVTGANGSFECSIQFDVTNTLRDNSFPLYDSYRYGAHPYIPLKDGFMAYTLFEFATQLTITPESAKMSIGLEYGNIENAVEHVVDSSESSVGATGGALFSKHNKLRKYARGANKIIKKGARFVNDANRVVQKGMKAYEAAKNVIDGGDMDMYG